jgi:hypothetical protein
LNFGFFCFPAVEFFAQGDHHILHVRQALIDLVQAVLHLFQRFVPIFF